MDWTGAKPAGGMPSDQKPCSVCPHGVSQYRLWMECPGKRRPRRNWGGRIDRTWQLMGWEHPEWETVQPLGLQLGWLRAVTEDWESPGTGLCMTAVVLEIMSSGS